MFDWLTPHAPKILAVLRILSGIMIAMHGFPKLARAFGDAPNTAPLHITWVAGPIELVGGALIALGLFTRPAAFLMSGQMAFAYFLGHASRGWSPVANRGELPIVYCWLMLYLAAHGPGAWSLDGWRGKGGHAPDTVPRA